MGEVAKVILVVGLVVVEDAVVVVVVDEVFTARVVPFGTDTFSCAVIIIITSRMIINNTKIFLFLNHILKVI